MKNRKKRTSFKRKAEILTLVALGTMSISGSFAYVSVKNAEKDNGNNGSILTPDIDRDDDDSSHDALSYILNNMRKVIWQSALADMKKKAKRAMSRNLTTP